MGAAHALGAVSNQLDGVGSLNPRERGCFPINCQNTKHYNRVISISDLVYLASRALRVQNGPVVFNIADIRKLRVLESILSTR